MHLKGEAQATPPEVAGKLSAELRRAIESPAVRARLQEIGLEPIPSDAPAMSTYWTSEMRYWPKLIRERKRQQMARWGMHAIFQLFNVIFFFACVVSPFHDHVRGLLMHQALRKQLHLPDDQGGHHPWWLLRHQVRSHSNA